ncbi:MAG: putative addiction module antidote protein [Alphaproteobacteria bacterium]|nr:putative addiction module antidote protein [Alphaproteobacteria bacterium]
MRKLRKFKEALLEDLKDPQYAQTYLSVALEEYEKDKDVSAFLMALRDVVEAKGGITKLAEKTHLNRQSLYKSLSAEGDPKLNTVETVLNGLGYRLSVIPLNEQRTPN